MSTLTTGHVWPCFLSGILILDLEVSMALIKDRKPKQSTGGYERLFNDEQLGALLARVQSTVIANGYELEKILAGKFNSISNLDQFIENYKNGLIASGVYNCSKKALKNSSHYKKGNQPDLLIFDTRNNDLKCYIVELKDGNSFDTKKSKGESDHIKKFYKSFSLTDIEYEKQYYFCCFNETNRDNLIAGFKKNVNKKHLITGDKFCELFNIDYKQIVEDRKKEGNDNIEFLIQSLISLPNINSVIKKYIS